MAALRELELEADAGDMIYGACAEPLGPALGLQMCLEPISASPECPLFVRRLRRNSLSSNRKGQAADLEAELDNATRNLA